MTTEAPQYDCRLCGACCVEAGPVTVNPDDKVPRYLTRSVRRTMGFYSDDHEYGIRQMAKETGGRCRALKGTVGVKCRCGIYDRRPTVCREFEPGSDGCVESREIAARKRARAAEWAARGYEERAC